jgi:Pin2-interacting protein X1
MPIDTSTFGFKMLQKMGWTEGKGLGMKEDGQKEHIKVKVKANNTGIGGEKRTIDNWMGNTSGFDSLLKNLNEEVDGVKIMSLANIQSDTKEAEESRQEMMRGRLRYF